MLSPQETLLHSALVRMATAKVAAQGCTHTPIYFPKHEMELIRLIMVYNISSQKLYKRQNRTINKITTPNAKFQH